jgi:hypothetical protein
MMGRFMSMAGMGGDPVTSTISVKGNRMSTMDERTGQIIDLAEERIYQLDVRKREYRIVTFEEMRKQLQEMKDRLAQQTQQMNEADQAAAKDAAESMEIDVNVRETGEKKAIAGQESRQVILTLTLRQKGQTLEEGGGFVMTNDMWLAPQVATLDELTQFQMRFAKAVFGEALGLDPRQASGISAMIPAFGSLATRMAEESHKLQGTALVTTSTIETVRNEEQLKAAEQQSGGGGIAGGLANRLMRRSAPQARSTTMTMTHEMLSIDATVAEGDVQIPSNFKEKK